MPAPTKTIPAVSAEPTPANPHRQPRNFTSVQDHMPGQRKASPASRPSGPPAPPPSRRPATRQRTVCPAPRRRRPPRLPAQPHRDPAGTARRAVRAASTSLGVAQDPQAWPALPQPGGVRLASSGHGYGKGLGVPGRRRGLVGFTRGSAPARRAPAAGRRGLGRDSRRFAPGGGDAQPRRHPFGARIADAAGGGLVWERRGGVVSKSGVG
jgi:hypothetical protein